MIKLIATDMDGTFLDSSKNFSFQFIDLFYELQKRNIVFTIASGNQYFRLYQKFLPMSNQMYFIGDNGSYIAKGSTVLKTNVIAKEKVFQITECINKIGHVKMILAGVKNAYALRSDLELQKEIARYYCNYQFVDNYEDIEDDIIKIALFDGDGKITQYANAIEKSLPKGVKSITSGNEWIDIQNEDINKGIAIKYLQELLDIKPEECMAFGDQMNDYSLLQNVKYSYAMANAVLPIKELAYGITSSNDENGVIKVIKNLLENSEESL